MGEKQMIEKASNKAKNDEIKFVSTTPICDKDKYGIYTDILEEQIKAERVYNIGIIAPYGAGKSSLIRTYKDTKLNHWWSPKFTTISMANFNSENDIQTSNNSILKQSEKTDTVTSQAIDALGDDKSNVVEQTQIGLSPIQDIESDIEKSILEQIIFKERKSKLPHSRLKRINNRHWLVSLVIALLMTVTIALVCCGILEYIKKLPYSDGSNFYYFFGFANGCVLILLFMLFNSNRLNKISVKDIEADVSGNTTHSVLNTFIDEILYYFSSTKTEIVIIEDLDRFNNTHIFSKLRELNFLINNSKIVKQKVTFIYAIKDTLFKTEDDRAKFFDYIISLVPVLSFTNSRDIMQNEMKKSCSNDMLLPSSYIYEVSHFIKEMRILKNVINDYITYYQVLNVGKFEIEDKNIKLFSLMLYKNLRPVDFAELQFGQGILSGLFESMKNQADEEVEVLKREVKELERKQILANELKINSFNTFKSFIKGMLIDNNEGQYCNVSYTNINSLTTFVGVTGLTYTNRYAYNCTVAHLEKKLGDTLINLENRIKERSTIKLNDVNNELTKKRTKIRQLLNCSMQEFINENEQFIEDELIGFFLANGYIAEDYKEFVAHSDQDLLTEHDKVFVRSVLVKRTLEYSIKLNNPFNVIREIGAERFLDKYVLNYDLVSCLLAYKGNRQDFLSKKDNLIKYLSSRETLAKRFIKNCIIDRNDLTLLIKTLAPNNTYLIYDLLTDDEITNDYKALIIRQLLECFDKSEIVKQNYNDVLFTFMNNYFAVIDEISTANIDKFKALSFELKLKVKSIECNESYYDVSKYLVEQNLYEINERNLKFILCTLKNCQYEQYLRAPLSAIFATKDTNFINYISANIKDVLNVINDWEGQTIESQSVIETILKDEAISRELRQQFISKQAGSYSFIDGIDIGLLQQLFDENKINVNWENVVLAYRSQVNWGSVMNFVCKNADDFGNIQLLNKPLVIALCRVGDWDLQAFEKLSKAFYVDLRIPEVQNDSILAILIKNGIVQCVEQNLGYLNSKPKSIVQVLIKNEELINAMDINMYDRSTIESVILNLELQDYLKSKIIEKTKYVPDSQSAIEATVKILIRYPVISCEKSLLDKIIKNDKISSSEKFAFIRNNDTALSEYTNIELLAEIEPAISGLICEKEIKLMKKTTVKEEILSFLEEKGFCKVGRYKYGTKITTNSTN